MLKVPRFGGNQWHGIHTKFHEHLSMSDVCSWAIERQGRHMEVTNGVTKKGSCAGFFWNPKTVGMRYLVILEMIKAYC
jgi:hypothetical protein